MLPLTVANGQRSQGEERLAVTADSVCFHSSHIERRKLNCESYRATEVKLSVNTEARLGNCKTQECILVFPQGFIQEAASAIMNTLKYSAFK
jgi:hypothetical protein